MATSKLWLATLLATLLALSFYGAGCTRRSLSYEADGGSSGDGGSACSRRSTADCESDTRCVVQVRLLQRPVAVRPRGHDAAGLSLPGWLPGSRRERLHRRGRHLRGPSFCFECSCTATFIACRTPSDPQTMCPLSDCAQPDCQCQGLDESECISGDAVARLPAAILSRLSRRPDFFRVSSAPARAAAPASTCVPGRDLPRPE